VTVSTKRALYLETVGNLALDNHGVK
jgi:hypothetical protein